MFSSPQLVVYALLIIATTLYARWLYLSDDRQPEHPDQTTVNNPSRTWVLVVFGTGLVLLAHAAAVLLEATPLTLDMLVTPTFSPLATALLPVLAFVLGGIPIIVGEQLRARKRRRREAERKRRNNGGKGDGSAK
jgi:hypothetical protein